MGTLKYAILGLLNRKSMTGYDMAKEFETSLFEFWNAKHSQIYPELKLLVKKGLIEYKIEIVGSILEKKLYSITEQGRKEFKEWAVSHHSMKAVPKDEFRLQLFFSDSLTYEERLKVIYDQLREHQEKIAVLEEKMSKFGKIPPCQKDEFTDYMVLLGAVMREKACCEWLETCIDLCTRDGEPKV